MAKKKNKPIIIVVDMAPPTVNHMWLKRGGTGGRFLSKEARVYISTVIATLAIQRQRMPQDWPFCAVDIVVEPIRRQGDVDNRIKAVLDAFTKAGFWEDDKVVAEVSCKFGKVCKPHGRTIVTISPREKKFY